MKKLILLIILLLAAHDSSFARSAFPELDKIKQIKLLDSTREDVKRIFSEFEEDFEDDEEDGEIRRDEISTENLVIRFSYSLGSCSDEEEWNVPKAVVTEINVILKNSVKAKDLKLDLSKLERIKEDDEETDETDEEEPDDFIYYDKTKSVSYELSDDEIENIKFTPAEKDFPALCNNETVRASASHKEWLLAKLRDRSYVVISEGFASVSELILSKNEFTIDCPASDSNETENNFDYAKINVEVKPDSRDPTDVLTYNYTVSGGQIVGTGANVVWDLSGVEPGSYTITAGADNGCGLCGTTKTETVIIKAPVCPKK